MASEYAVTVHEPSRGVETTTIAAPGSFDATSPANGGSASLSGFTLTWSNADPNQKIRITLTQTLFGEERSEAFGAVMDTGTMAFSAEDLAEFQQGANLAIALTRINERTVINGFNTGKLTVERSKTLLVTPGP